MSLHLDDPDLIRHLDSALEPQDRIALQNHLDTCEVCASKLRLIDRRSRRLEQLLVAGDPPVPPFKRIPDARFRVTRPIAAAAAMTILIGASIVVSPVRAWIVEQSRVVWTLVTRAGHDTEPAAQSSDSTRATASVTFKPVRRSFVIRIARRQTAGSVTVETGAVTEVTALVLGGGNAEDMLVLPDGLLVRNSNQSVASYQVTVPASLDTITVEVDGRLLVTLAPRGAPSRWTSGLQAADPP